MNVHGDALCFMVKTWGETQNHRKSIEQWRLVAVGGGWRLAAVDGWQLVVGGGWRLAVGGWWSLWAVLKGCPCRKCGVLRDSPDNGSTAPLFLRKYPLPLGGGPRGDARSGGEDRSRRSAKRFGGVTVGYKRCRGAAFPHCCARATLWSGPHTDSFTLGRTYSMKSKLRLDGLQKLLCVNRTSDPLQSAPGTHSRHVVSPGTKNSECPQGLAVMVSEITPDISG